MTDPSMVSRARRFAESAHAAQSYGDSPYVVHLDAVVDVLREYHYEQPAVLCAGFLHDAVEDTGVTLDEVAREFGDEVATLVAFCTDEPGESRKARKARTLERMRRDLESPHADARLLDDAIAVKLADRLANVRNCVARGNEGLLAMYRREHAAFRTTLHQPGRHDALWAALDAVLGQPPRGPDV